MTLKGDFHRRVGVCACQFSFLLTLLISSDNVSTSSFPLTFSLLLFVLLLFIGRGLNQTHKISPLPITILNTLGSFLALLLFYEASKIQRPIPITNSPTSSPTPAATPSFDLLLTPPVPDTGLCSFVGPYQPLNGVNSNSDDDDILNSHLVYRSGCPNLVNKTISEIDLHKQIVLEVYGLLPVIEF